MDGLYFLLTAVSAFFTLLIFVLILFLAVKYRRSVHPHPEQIEGSLPLELAWTLIPLGICMVFFAWGSLIFFQEGRPPKGAMEVYAVAKQWMWKFEYEGGQRDIHQLHVPVGRDVKMIMSSQDVIHSFYVPSFRIKAHVLPGCFTGTWFRPTKPGTYHLFCAGYCGTDHSGMIGQVIVMEPAAYQAWMSGGSTTGSLASNGGTTVPAAWLRCHCFDTQGRRPESDRHLWQAGVVGRWTQPLLPTKTTSGESITNPGAKIVSGFKPIMPTFQGQVSEENLMALVAYIKSLSQPQQKGSAEQPTGCSGSFERAVRF